MKNTNWVWRPQIRSALRVVADSSLQLLNHQGMPLQVISLAGGQLDAPIRFRDLGHLRPGLYTIRLHNGDKVVSKRILKG